MTIEPTFKLSDKAIAQIARLLQVAILSGTDIVDNLRVIEFGVEDGLLIPTTEFLERIDSNVTGMLSELESAGVDTSSIS
ncbi:MAG TPA: hypothetical protein EYG51_25040 [Pseudomonadales bacterium]|nr:hypothetical protein [Pseudomonadales bacterium]